MMEAASCCAPHSAAEVSIPTTCVPLSASFSPTSSRRLSTTAVQIALDEAEQQLFATLVATVAAFENGEIQVPNRPHSRLEVRIAGGWIRDKLLGLQTHDVDVAVDCLTGVEFAKLVQAYLKKYSKEDLAGKMGVICANPAQSKHLETATMKVCGLEVDFCNLRAQEIYQHNSRIPIVRFGTPLEDTERRDFTVNSLFYNLRSKCVEDWTKSGLRDLLAGKLVTPLEPVQTFRDDPLRVLRAIRFAVRYNFTLDPALEAACMNEEIHKALHIKVSRERVGKELEGMLSGKGARPTIALDTIARLKLAGSVFCIPKVGEDNVAAINGHILGNPYGEHHHDSPQARHVRELGWEESRIVLQLLPMVLEAHNKVVVQGSSSVDLRLLPLAVHLLPFRTLSYQDVKKTGKQIPVVQFVFRDGIKFKNKDVNASTVLQETVDRMAGFLTEIAVDQTYQNTLPVCRLDAGLLLRTTKELWVTCLLLATVLKIRQQQQGQDGVVERKIDWIQLCQSVYKTIIDFGLDECWKMKPLMDGKAVIQALNLPRGPVVGTYLDEQVRWMLMNPDGSREDCESHLMSLKRRLEGQSEEQNAANLGMSDGTGNTPSSPVQGDKKVARHFSKKMHVESMDLADG